LPLFINALQTNCQQTLADFRKLALKYHPDRIINEPERKALYNEYFQELSNIRDRIQQDWEQVLKGELMDDDLEAIRNQFAELNKGFEKIWQTLKETGERHKEIHQLQGEIAEQHRQIHESLEIIKEISKKIARLYQQMAEGR
jgi:curved DNA-binding protein CbpA